MKHNLMGKEKIENLGFGGVNSYENEKEVSFIVFLTFSEKNSDVQEVDRSGQNGRAEHSQDAR